MAQLVVITNPDLTPGFRLAGVRTYAVDSADAAGRRVSELLEEGEAGVIALDQAYLDGLDAKMRQRLEEGYRPVVIGLPTGRAARPGEGRRQQLAELIRRAIGVRITFGGSE